MTKTIRIESDNHWHRLRREHVGGSEIAALFGEHPHFTSYELWQRKAGRVPEPDLSGNDRVLWGAFLEPAVARGVAAKTGWNVQKVHRYYSALPELALGGSIDHEIISNERGPGVLEIKCVDWMVARNWEDGQPPLGFELQVQTYLALTGRAWACLATLIGGNDLRLFMYERRPKTIALIKEEVAAFWQSVKEGIEPKPDFAKDAATINRLYAASVSGKTIDLSLSNRAPQLVADYLRGRDMETDGKTIKEAAKAELLPMLGDAEAATCGTARISAKMIGAKEISYLRREYRDFRISEKKERTA